MKLSRYNHHIIKGNYSYWYNGLTNSYFRLSKNTGAALFDSIRNIEEIEQHFPSLYDKLKSGGFYIDNDFDEIGVIRERSNATKNSQNSFLIIIPTLNCNFSCWYCIQDHISSIMSEETIEKVKRHIDYLINVEKIDSLHIDWFGGEPLMFFKKVAEPISRYAKSRCFEKGIPFLNGATTNAFYLTAEKYAILKQLEFKHFQITIDGNKEYHDNVKVQKGLDSSFDHALNNINGYLLFNKDANVTLRINYTHSNLNEYIVEQVSSKIETSVRSRVCIMPRKVWQEDVDNAFITSLNIILRKFENDGFKVLYWEPTIDGVPCYVSKELYKTINYNGFVLKCTANDDMYSKSPKGIINDDGSITWDEDYFNSYNHITFENGKCLACKYLPGCYGQCPRNWISHPHACKLDSSDNSFDESLIEFIDQKYRTN